MVSGLKAALAFSSLTAAKMGRGQGLAAAEGDLLALLLPSRTLERVPEYW
ncbi:hypothetical protein J7E87_30280 [Streptomyces sp. ISL-1]|nr:hypothetical protein [Streptomyces sp. ISL-1]MBT2393585.1 hypothetical protein [Streptomyces sp. ISL-1]